MDETLIKAVNLSKRYGSTLAVNNVTFHVTRGECFGFLGPNGAGKTTTMRMLYGFSPPDSGEITIFDLSVSNQIREIKRRIGVVPQENSLDPELTVHQNLMMYGRYFSIPKQASRRRSDELLHFFHLQEKKEAEIDKLSGGMKRRLLIARALMNQPECLILDEPTTGLDPQSRHVMWDRLRELKSQGVTSILTTHYMEEASQLCDRLVIMDDGEIIEEGTPKNLITKHGVTTLEEVFLKLTGRELRE